MAQTIISSGTARRGLRSLIAVVLLIVGTGSAAAADAAPSDEWDLVLVAYLWAPSIGATTAAGDDIDIPVGDIVEDLDFMFMGSLGGRGGRWSVFADLIYLNISQTENSTANLIGQPINTSVGMDLKGSVVNLVGGYTAVQTDEFTFDVIVGTRYLYLDTDLSFAIGNQSIPFSGSGGAWDGIIGVRGHAVISEKWFFSYYLDVGTGESDSTWQALAGLGYQLPKLDVVFGYRYMEWDFEDDDPIGGVFDDIDFNGPYAGVKFVF